MYGFGDGKLRMWCNAMSSGMRQMRWQFVLRR